MCGITGYYLKNIKYLNQIDLKKANIKLKHRGPDFDALYFNSDKTIGLGHTRLSIQDLNSIANQPMKSNCERFVIVFNGEIYNFLELKNFLLSISKEYVFNSESDTEVILNFFKYCDKENKTLDYFLSKLQGIFSIAIWDNYLQKLLLARDSFGVKPIYYFYSDEKFFFASEIKALNQLGINISEIDHQAIDLYLKYIWCPGEKTPSTQIKKVLPGEVLVLNKGVLTEKYIWYRHPYKKEIKKLSKKKFIFKKTENLLRQAIHKQLVSDVPLGAFLSGGLDSSTIVSFAREKIPNIKCFTIQTKESLKSDGFVDDFKYAQLASKHLCVPLCAIEVDKYMLIENIEDMVYHLDEPIADPASINVLLISKLARENGIKVLLSGTGGDDLFSGYRRHYALGKEYYWSFFPKIIRKNLTKLTSGLTTKNVLLRRIKKNFSGAELTPDERIINYFRWGDLSLLENLYSNDFHSIFNQNNYEDPLFSYLSSLPNKLSKLDKMLALEQRFFLSDHNLLYTDKMSMQNGVEVRVPFLDHDLVEFASQLPSKYKNNKGELKWILKKVMETYLPKEIIYRPKTGFGAPIRKWIKDELREWVYEMLSYKTLKNRNLFDPKAVHKLIQDNIDNKVDAGYTILSLVCIEIWCRKFIDSQ